MLKDPRRGGSEADIGAQGALLKSVMADINTAAGLVNSLENTRAQLAVMRAQASSDTTGAAHRAGMDSLERKLVDAESQLRNVLGTGRGQDGIRNPVKIGEKLLYLANSIGGSDYAPTEAQQAVAKDLHEQLMAAQAMVDGLMKGDVMEFHKAMSGGSRTP